MMRARSTVVSVALMAVALATSADLHAQMLTGPDLVAALRSGGLVIVMRHASSPRQPPAKEAAQPDNVTLERQLDAAGRASATAMGDALRRLKIPVGDVLTSPTFRARETVRYAQLANAKAVDELGDGGQSMQGAAEKQGAWLREKAAAPSRGTNPILVTHMPNIARAFPDITDVADGESLVFRPDGKGGSSLIGRIPIDAWGALR